MSKFNVILEKMEKRYDSVKIGKKTYYLKEGQYVGYLEEGLKSKMLVIYFDCPKYIQENSSQKIAVIFVRDTVIWTKKIEFLQIERITKKSDSFWIQSDVEIRKSRSLYGQEEFVTIGKIFKDKEKIIFDSEIVNIEIFQHGKKIRLYQSVAVMYEQNITIDDWREQHSGTIEYPYWHNNCIAEIIV